MRWVNMGGPVGPIIKLMAAYYARRVPIEYDDLVQIGWLGVMKRPHVKHAHAAYSAITHAILADKRYRKRLAKVAQLEVHRDRTPRNLTDARLDAAVILDRCNDLDLEILYLRFWEDLSISETAARMGANPSTVKSRGLRLKDRLRHLAG